MKKLVLALLSLFIISQITAQDLVVTDTFKKSFPEKTSQEVKATSFVVTDTVTVGEIFGSYTLFPTEDLASFIKKKIKTGELSKASIMGNVFPTLIDGKEATVFVINFKGKWYTTETMTTAETVFYPGTKVFSYEPPSSTTSTLVKN